MSYRVNDRVLGPVPMPSGALLVYRRPPAGPEYFPGEQFMAVFYFSGADTAWFRNPFAVWYPIPSATAVAHLNTMISGAGPLAALDDLNGVLGWFKQSYPLDNSDQRPGAM
jgi:hypothetical protein